MGPKSLNSRDFLPQVAQSVLAAGDEFSCRIFLSELEKEIRNRLEFSSEADSLWFPEIARVLSESATPHALDLKAELLLLIVQWHYSQQRSSDGIALATCALEFSRRANAPSLQRRALNNLGLLHIDTKNLGAATVCLVEGLRIAERLGDRVGKCAILANLATARFEAGLLDEAIKLYRYVIDLAGNELLLQQIRIESHHNISLAALILDDLVTARHYMDLAIQSLMEPTTSFLVDQRVVMELTFTKIMVRLGDNEGANRRARIANAYVTKGSRRARIQSQLAAVLCDAAAGRTDIALTRLSLLESEVSPSEPAYRDVLEIELLCNRLAGHRRYERYYSQRYLSNLAEWQRKTAIQQLAAVKKTILGVGRLSTREFQCLPMEAAKFFEPGQGKEPEGFRAQLETLAILSEVREDATGEHSFRVARLAGRLAIAVGYSIREAETLELATRLHDIGKLAVPDAVLLKRGRLSSAEELVIRRHTTEGCQMLTDILSTIESSDVRADVHAVRCAAEIALHHHEWWDGTGYPRGVAGDQIPEPARIAAIADAFDELTHARPYKRALSVATAMAKISALSGKQFEPRLCDEFLKMVATLDTGRTSSGDDLTALIGWTPAFASANRVIQRIIRSIGTADIKGHSA